MIFWFFAKTGYYMFYAMGYKIEHTYNKWIKIANMLVIFVNANFFCYALFNHADEKQYKCSFPPYFLCESDVQHIFCLDGAVAAVVSPLSREH